MECDDNIDAAFLYPTSTQFSILCLPRLIDIAVHKMVVLGNELFATDHGTPEFVSEFSQVWIRGFVCNVIHVWTLSDQQELCQSPDSAGQSGEPYRRLTIADIDAQYGNITNIQV